MSSGANKVTELIEPTVEALGLDLWGIELLQQGKFTVLRIFIESGEGITIEDCEKVSRQVSAILDVEDPISGEYTLEVSSPGIDRPLFKISQFEEYADSEVDIKMRSPLDGRRKFKGRITKIDGNAIRIDVDGTEYDLDHSDIEKASVVFR
ncbi:MAG: ribosome maturation factor RimP [Pseudohongiellaceae bacterium]